MYLAADHTLTLIDQAVARSDSATLRAAIRAAFVGNAPVEHIATRARTTIAGVLAVIDEMYAEPAAC
ncbi:hypothetical protein Cs7R123_67710 [Catellatospora sp. TT07R-123]|uniref:hypothetical protein n=1 Tax=Catellatospora sp. TT07R-123 TaxID=2733863 RepID=UPI001B035755|nr:hypothetical protein [Catellatospora sp. TT07R-123]GHJ49429.1 hypothetical protein Cs7R123_67710 [Catellatospora sp. TT07R-123]